VNVLILGESGTGKELVARAIYHHGTRAGKPFMAINCAAIPETLIENELFGALAGSHSTAHQKVEGKVAAAEGGTLFLDEIGELPLELQPKLLRVLESSTVRRVGGTREIEVDTRIIAATHRNLEELVEDGEFREDLFHRLFVLSIRVPPVRERPGDILPLARHFLQTQAPERGLALDKNAERALLEYSWPGNIRELRNIIVRSILMTDGALIRAADLQFSKDEFSPRARDARVSVRQLEQDDRQRMIDALEKTDGNRAEAARMLGLSKSTFHDRLKRYGIPTKYR
jgi:two-component system NtrC family response regulator